MDQFCLDDEGDLSPRDLMNNISRMAFPSSQENMFAFSFTCLEFKGEKKTEVPGAFCPRTQRTCFEDNFNQKLDDVLLGLSRDTPLSNEWRVCTGNEKYAICPSYPKYFVVPQALSDEDVNTLAKFHKKKRLPLICWRHPLTKCFLLRSALPKTPR